MNTTLSILDRTVGELAAEMPASIRVFELWKIDYCCGGSRAIADACATAGHSVEEFAAALEATADRPSDNSQDWQTAGLSAVRAHIVDGYHRFTRAEIETLGGLAEKVLGVHGSRRPELSEVRQLVATLREDLLPHMLKEEQVLFPYVDQLEETAAGHRSAPTPFFGTVKNPVRMMMVEHDRVGELLARLRVVTGGFIAPADGCFSYRELYRRIAEFERITHEHIHVENNIYFPRAIELEERVGSGAAFAYGECCAK